MAVNVSTSRKFLSKAQLTLFRSRWLFEMLTKGHVCHVKVNKRSAIAVLSLCNALSGESKHWLLFKWACVQSVKWEQWHGQSDRWDVPVAQTLSVRQRPPWKDQAKGHTGNPLSQCCVWYASSELHSSRPHLRMCATTSIWRLIQRQQSLAK